MQNIIDVRNASVEIKNNADQDASDMAACCDNKFLVLKNNCISWIQDEGGVGLIVSQYAVEV